MFHGLLGDVLRDIQSYEKDPGMGRTITIKIKVVGDEKREYASYSIEGSVAPAKYRKLDGVMMLDIHDDGSIDAYEKRTDGNLPLQQTMDGGELPAEGVVQFPAERVTKSGKSAVK